jgi:hypothetical protein
MRARNNPKKTVINYMVEQETRERIMEIGRKTKRNPGRVMDRIVEIAYPILMGESKVKTVVVTKTE